MKKRSVAAAAENTTYKKPAKRTFIVPLVSQFYESPELPPIVDSATKLEWTSFGIYMITAVVFVVFVYQGLTTAQEVSVTVIVPVATGLGDGYECKNLGRYSGSPYSCSVRGCTGMRNVICNPSSPPVNCAKGKVNCSAVNFAAYTTTSDWKITMENVYFKSYDDCVSKMGSILQETVAGSTYYNISSFLDQLFLIWPPYKGPITIGDSTAKFTVALNFPLRYLNGFSMDVFLDAQGGYAFCDHDASNCNANGTMIENSALDIFAKTLPKVLLSEAFTDGPYCTAKPTAANICVPFKTIGPYSCTKTTKITQPILQVLGSSVSNAATMMTVLSIGLAWIIQKITSSDRIEDDKVAPRGEITAESAD